MIYVIAYLMNKKPFLFYHSDKRLYGSISDNICVYKSLATAKRTFRKIYLKGREFAILEVGDDDGFYEGKVVFYKRCI